MRFIKAFFLLIVLGYQPGFALELTDLEGYWRSKDSVIQINFKNGALEGAIAKISQKDLSIGYKLHDIVFKKFELNKNDLKFSITVRNDDPALSHFCQPATVTATAKVSANGAIIKGFYENGEFQHLEDDNGKVIICRFVKKPGKLPYQIERTYFTKPKILNVKYTRMDPNSELKDLVPLQFFRVTATLDQKPIPNHSEEIFLSNSRTKKKIKVNLTPYGEENLITSEMILVGLPETTNPEPQLPSCPKDIIEVSSETLQKNIKVIEGDCTFDPPPCKALPSPALYSLTAVGDTSRVYNPESSSSSVPLKVLLKDEKGKEVAREEIIWLSKDTGEAYVTETDKNGIARLDFAVTNRGKFYAVAEGLPVGNGFSDKKCTSMPSGSATYDFEVAPKHPLISIGIDNDPPTFKVEFVRPTIIEIWSRKESNLKSVLYDDRFFIRIWAGRYIYRRTQPINVQLKGNGGDSFERPAKRVKYVVGPIFETTEPIYASRMSNHSDNCLAVPQHGGIITFSAAGGKLLLPVYPTSWDRQYREAIKQLALVEDVLTAVLGVSNLPKNQKTMNRIKLELVGAANRWMRERLSLKYKTVLINTYLGLVMMEPSELGAKIDMTALEAAKAYQSKHGGPKPFPISIRMGQPAVMRFSYETERDKVIAAFLIARTQNFKVIASQIKSLFDVSFEKALKGLKQAIIAPGLSTYTAVTGWTVDGEVATSYQRLVGGVEGMVGFVSISMAVPKLAALGQTSASFLRRVTSGRSRSVDLNFSQSNATSGLTISKALADEAVEAAKAAKRRKRTLKKYMGKVDKANAKLEVLKKKKSEEYFLRETLEADLKKMNAELQTRIEQGKTRNKGRIKTIGIQERKIQRLDKRVAGLNKKIAKESLKKRRSYSALGRMERDGLSKLEVQVLIDKGHLPGAWDKIADTFVHRLYETYVAKRLGPDFVKSKGITLNTSHPGVLLEKKFGEPLTSPKRQIRTKSPEMDHVNDITGEVADSKYYDFERKRRELTPKAFAEYKKKAAREIVETVEKGRMVQREIIREKRMDREKRGYSLPELDDELKDNLVNRVVYQRQVTIITPVNVPPDVIKDIKFLVGKRSAKMLRFRVIRPPLASWAARSRF